MIAREKLELEHPERVNVGYIGGCLGCPSDYGYLFKPMYCRDPRYGSNLKQCTDCWDREIPGEKEKENKPMKKTKAMLEEELEQKQTEIEGLKKELETEIKKTEKYKQFEECADDLKALQNSFINSGFSDKQAFMMVLQIIGTSHPKN